ncbi:FGGY-family carbohydrate kinase [Neobacillus bataviensis]|uniref:FGGY-family carbohydrate kinase n=1 Tax=Neobacillus bataviensis TaxID=220685 RepID=UPI001CBD1933|nr:FGGY family carbohydrate kinase [Neobacillus bataviensis]
MIIAIDIGTTNLKAGLFEEDGTCITTSSRQTKYATHSEGFAYIDAQSLWNTVAQLIKEVNERCGFKGIRAVSITSMAESGLLVNKETGRPATEIIPWFDSSSINQASFIEREIDPFVQFCQTGLHLSYKYGLAKLLWLRHRHKHIFDQEVMWLSVSSYIAYCLTGKMAEEQTLAARTFAYRINQNEWDKALIDHFGFRTDLFPNVTHCLWPVGEVKQELAGLGLKSNTNVYIAGHDHVSSSLAAGIVSPGNVYNSMGTAETLVGTFTKRELTKADYESGLSFGLHPQDNLYFWMGGHSSSGGSVEWLRDILGNDRLTYAEINDYLEMAGDNPTGIIFYPYLSGSGAPKSNPHAKAAFIGLKKNHGKTDLLKAVLEGNSFQMEMIREEAEKATGIKMKRMSVIGGGVRNPHWIKIKANVSGSELVLPDITEAALCGAALIAAVGEGLFLNLNDAVANTFRKSEKVVQPNKEIYKKYRTIYENQFKPLSLLIEKC